MHAKVIPLQAPPEDAQLVEQALGGDVRAKRRLFERHVAHASAIAFRLAGNEADMEDIVQDSFVAAFNALPRLAEPQAFRAWLSSIVARTAIGLLRKRRLLTRLGLLRAEPVQLESLVSADAPLEVVAELHQVYAFIDRLPAEERVCLVLRRFEELSLDEVAAQTGASLATVKRRIARAEQRLRVLAEKAPKPPGGLQ